MRIFSKLMSVLLGTTLVLSLVACGNTDVKSTSTETSTVTQQTQKEEVKKDPVSLKVLLLYADDARKTIHDKYFVPNIKKELPDYDVEFELGGGGEDYTNKLKTYNASGEMPDIWYATGPNVMQPIVKAGNVEDLLPYITKDGFADKYKNKAVIAPETDGKLYGLLSGSDAYFTPRVFYNKDIFEKYGVAVPKTLDEFMAACKVFNQNGIVPVSLYGKAGWSPQQFLFQELVMSENPQAVTDLASGKAKWSDKIYVDAMNTIQNMVNEGVFQKGLTSMDDGAVLELFTSKKAAMFMNMSWNLPTMAKDPNIDFMIFPQTNTAVDNSQRVMFYGGTYAGYAVSSKSKSIGDAVKLAEWLTVKDATFFNADSKSPTALDTGIKIEGMPDITARSVKQFDEAPNKILVLYASFNSKTSAETGVLFEKLLTGKYSGEDFAKDIEKTWSENFTN